jgi:hypothetical protein
VLLPVPLEARSEPVGVHDSLGYEGVLPARHKPVGAVRPKVADVKNFRAPAILFASEAAG